MDRVKIYTENTPYIFITEYAEFYFTTKNAIIRFSKNIYSNRNLEKYKKYEDALHIDNIPNLLKDLDLYYRCERIYRNVILKGCDKNIWLLNGQGKELIDLKGLLKGLIK